MDSITGIVKVWCRHKKMCEHRKSVSEPFLGVTLRLSFVSEKYQVKFHWNNDYITKLNNSPKMSDTCI